MSLPDGPLVSHTCYSVSYFQKRICTDKPFTKVSMMSVMASGRLVKGCFYQNISIFRQASVIQLCLENNDFSNL